MQLRVLMNMTYLCHSVRKPIIVSLTSSDTNFFCKAYVTEICRKLLACAATTASRGKGW